MILRIFAISFIAVLLMTSSECLRSRPRLIAFDLDGTVWSPDMYQLWGGGSPFTLADKLGKVLHDRNNRTVRLLGVIPTIFDDFRSKPEWKDTKIAWVSKTDEPEWAEECLSKFLTAGGEPLTVVAHSSQIFHDDKRQHFKNLKNLYPDIEYDEMLFFDNEIGNIRSVSKLGVKCLYCPQGVTSDAWESGLSLFEQEL